MLHETDVQNRGHQVRSLLLPSEKVPVAVSLRVAPRGRARVCGAAVIVASVGTVKFTPLLLLAAQATVTMTSPVAAPFGIGTTMVVERGMELLGYGDRRNCSGIAKGVAIGPATMQASAGGISGSTTVTVNSARFRLTDKLTPARDNPLAVSLNNGEALVVGGSGGNGVLFAAANLYDPVVGSFILTGSLNIGRYYSMATLLRDGRVLIAGGLSAGGDALVAQAQCEIDDPATGYFAFKGSLNIARAGHTATTLSNGKVLITGGRDGARCWPDRIPSDLKMQIIT